MILTLFPSVSPSRSPDKARFYHPPRARLDATPSLHAPRHAITRVSRWFYQLPTLAGWLMLATPAPAADPAAFDETIDPAALARHYAGEQAAVPWFKAVEALTGNDVVQSRAVGRFLVALTQQALADETSGTARWHATPYWGSAMVLEKAAKRVLVEPREWAELDAAQVAKRIDEIIDWAKQRRDKTEAELLLENLADLTKRDESWLSARDAAAELVKSGVRSAFPLIALWLESCSRIKNDAAS